MGAACFPHQFAAALVLGTIRVYYPGKSPKGREIRYISRLPCGCGVQTASAQSGPALDASKQAALELLLTNRDCKCCLFPAERHSMVWGDGGKADKSRDRRESMLKFSFCPPLQGWMSDKNADLLLSLGEGEAIAVSAHLTLRQRAGVAGEPEPECASLPLPACSDLGFYLPFASGLPTSPCSPPAPAQPTNMHPQPFCNTLHRGRPLTLPDVWKTPSQRCIFSTVACMCLWVLEHGSEVVGSPKRGGCAVNGTDTGRPQVP